MKPTNLMSRLTCFLERTANRLAHRFARTLLLALFWSTASGLMILIGHYGTKNQFQAVGVAALTPLALLLAFSGLMYNRARAVESKRDRFRSVYAAERFMAATFYYLIALVLGFIITLVFVVAPSANAEALGAAYCSVILFSMFSFTELSLAVRAVCPNPFSRKINLVARMASGLLDKERG